jgi:hypothetical protein
LALVSNSSPHL